MSACRRTLMNAARVLAWRPLQRNAPLFEQPSRRSYAVASAASPRFQVFSKRTKWLQKERAGSNVNEGRQADYLKDEVARRVTERLLDINRQFPKVLDLGANSCNIARALTADNPDPDPAMPESPPLSTRISELTAVDSSETLLYRDASLDFNNKLNITRLVLEDEETLPFEPDVLKPDAPFIGALVTLVVVLGVQAAIMLFGGLRLMKKSARAPTSGAETGVKA
ncbi:hypothetical protein NQ176_g6090 [Zarea fungicola]|uniref:Uncharacterized protein n=1 Tax=Zarea fungicola TaxID=93591 RepID=A0ACC1N7E6_9HYPO|nr:hypothetical protein NQ176_g6090 [Lecanicillium fungicola]